MYPFNLASSKAVPSKMHLFCSSHKFQTTSNGTNLQINRPQDKRFGLGPCFQLTKRLFMVQGIIYKLLNHSSYAYQMAAEIGQWSSRWLGVSASRLHKLRQLGIKNRLAIKLLTVRIFSKKASQMKKSCLRRHRNIPNELDWEWITPEAAQ